MAHEARGANGGYGKYGGGGRAATTAEDVSDSSSELDSESDGDDVPAYNRGKSAPIPQNQQRPASFKRASQSGSGFFDRQNRDDGGYDHGALPRALSRGGPSPSADKGHRTANGSRGEERVDRTLVMEREKSRPVGAEQVFDMSRQRKEDISDSDAESGDEVGGDRKSVV